MKLGLIDSGIGGLTVLKRLLDNCPNHEYIYYGDTIHLPYGDKTQEEIIKYGNNIISFLEKEGVDVIILACGTLSSKKDLLKSNKKIIDIISPLENKLDLYKKIGIMATTQSIKTNAFKKYIKSELKLIACPKLVPMIENNNLDRIDVILKDYLKDTLSCDALVLGCTHYPIIRDYISNIFLKDIYSLDEFIVDEIKKLQESNYNLKVYYSKIDENIIKNTRRILKIENIEIERKCLND